MPNAFSTVLRGINDRGWMVGSYSESGADQHGLFLLSPTEMVTYDYPGAAFTDLSGINTDGLICGNYSANGIIFHGFILRVGRGPGE